MTLDDYLRGDEKRELPKVTEAELAEQVGCDQSTINRVRNGQKPSPKLALAILDKTGGMVTLNDLFGVAA